MISASDMEELRAFEQKPLRDGRARISISSAAFDAISAALPFGSVGYDAEIAAKGQWLIWLDNDTAEALGELRRSGESYSDVILRVAATNYERTQSDPADDA